MWRVPSVCWCSTWMARGAGDVAADLPAGTGHPAGLAGAAAEAEAEAVLARLTGWLAGVYLRYADAARTVPACWLWHPEVVEELPWPRQAWLAAYADPDAPVSLAADWHDRLRPGVVRRIRDYAGMCSIEADHRHPDRAVLDMPTGRGAAERRLATIAALHQPVLDTTSFWGPCLRIQACVPACRTNPWPCATAKLLGPWPGEQEVGGADV